MAGTVMLYKAVKIAEKVGDPVISAQVEIATTFRNISGGVPMQYPLISEKFSNLRVTLQQAEGWVHQLFIHFSFNANPPYIEWEGVDVIATILASLAFHQGYVEEGLK